MTVAQVQPQTVSRGLFDTGKLLYKTANRHDVFSTGRAANIDRLDRQMRATAGDGRYNAPADEFAPGLTLGPTDSFGDMDVAGNGLWFYTITYDKEYIVHNQYWTETVILGFELNVFDSDFSPIGTIKDKIRMDADETRVVLADVTPIVTRHFFNDDDRCEIMMGFGFNSDTPGINHYRTLVYTFDGEKDSDGYDLPCFSFDDIVTDVVDCTSDTGEENIYLTFANEEYPDLDFESIEDPGSFDFWNEWSMKIYMNIGVYTKVDSQGNLHPVMQKRVRMLEMPGDQENSPILMSMTHDGKPYMIISHYELPFYNDYSIMDYDSDLTMRDGNTLVAEIYRFDGSDAVLEQTTRIAAPRRADALASYYSVGDLRYRDDVQFDASGKATLMVTRNDKRNAADESGIKTYAAYNADGSLKATLISDCDGAVALSDVPGFEPQMMFIELTADSYIYHFIDMVSCAEKFAMNYRLEIDGSDPDPMSSNMERVAHGDSYAYVNEMVYPAEDDGTAYMRFTWLDDKGRLIGQDWVNMGQNVNYARSYLDAAVLKPGFYAEADDLAYMILIKRAAAAGITEELVIGHPLSDENPVGKTLLYLQPSDKGTLQTIAPISTDGTDRLMVGYLNDKETSPYLIDFYSLPLDKGAGVADITAEDTSIAFDGMSVSCEGNFIIVDTQGRTVLVGNGATDVTSLATGLYIVVAGSDSRKIFVK
ncbi:MAG: hypothetical protein Q4C34_06035 [Bacteroidales bacterium]|nr:hypothetical protein [Bacteroidales bacterium]